MNAHGAIDAQDVSVPWCLIASSAICSPSAIAIGEITDRAAYDSVGGRLKLNNRRFLASKVSDVLQTYRSSAKVEHEMLCVTIGFP